MRESEEERDSQVMCSQLFLDYYGLHCHYTGI
jgi:hypothetical protein